MQYDVTVRTKANGYLAFQYRLTLEQLATDKLYKEHVADKRYVVTLTPVKGCGCHGE